MGKKKKSKQNSRESVPVRFNSVADSGDSKPQLPRKERRQMVNAALKSKFRNTNNYNDFQRVSSPYDANGARWHRLAKFDFWVAGIFSSASRNTAMYRFKATGAAEVHVVLHATRVFIDDRHLLRKVYVPESTRQNEIKSRFDEEIADDESNHETPGSSPSSRPALNETTDLTDYDRRLVNPMLGDEPIFAFEGEFADDAKLLRSLGLPLGFLNSPFDLDNRKRLDFPADKYKGRQMKEPAVVYEAPMPGPWKPVDQKLKSESKIIYHASPSNDSGVSTTEDKPDLETLYKSIIAADDLLSSSSGEESSDESPTVMMGEEKRLLLFSTSEADAKPQFVSNDLRIEYASQYIAAADEEDDDQNSWRIDEDYVKPEKPDPPSNDTAVTVKEPPDVTDDPDSVWFVDDVSSSVSSSVPPVDSSYVSSLTNVFEKNDDENDENSSGNDDDDDDMLNQLLYNPSDLLLASVVMPDSSNSAIMGVSEDAVEGGRVLFSNSNAADNLKPKIEEIEQTQQSSDNDDKTRQRLSTFRIGPSSLKTKVNAFLSLSNSNNDNMGGDLRGAEISSVASTSKAVDPLEKMRYSTTASVRQLELDDTKTVSKRFKSDAATTDPPLFAVESLMNVKQEDRTPLVTVMEDQPAATSGITVGRTYAEPKPLQKPQRSPNFGHNKPSTAVNFNPDTTMSADSEDLLDFTADAQIYAGNRLQDYRALQVQLSHKGLGLPDRQGLVKLLHSFGLSCSYQPTSNAQVQQQEKVPFSQQTSPAVPRPRFGSSITTSHAAKAVDQLMPSSATGIQKYRVHVHQELGNNKKSRNHHSRRQKFLDFGRPHWETQNDLFVLMPDNGGGGGHGIPAIDLDAPRRESHAHSRSSSSTTKTPLGLDAAMPHELRVQGADGEKYWNQRYRLFSKFDAGIMIAPDSWCGITPERIGQHLALRCQCDVIVDAFGGCGGSAIQLAFTCRHVIYVEIDPIKVAYARHNAELYGVAENIEFIQADFFHVAPYLKADAVFLSPPWGGPTYQDQRTVDLNELDLDGVRVFEAARKISPNIAYFLPRNINVEQLVELAARYDCDVDDDDDGGGGRNQLEIEQQFLNTKLKTITAYFGALVDDETFITDR